MNKPQFFNDIKSVMKDAWLGIDVNTSTLPNPLENIPPAIADKPELYFMWLMSQPEYFYLTCKVLFNKTCFPMQCVLLEELWTHQFPMLIGSRGMSKSFTLALYILLRLIFLENRKIVIAGAGFRQSKVVFQYMEDIVNGSPILSDYLYSTNKNPFSKANDEWRLTIGSSNAIAIPIGTGDKIRGKRANDIIADEFASMLIDIFETVIAGFGAVSAAPDKNIKKHAAEQLMKKLGLTYKDIEDFIEPTAAVDNQIIISGTAYYDFNHFSQYHEKWLKIIKSRGDKAKLKEAFGGDVQDALNWKDYSVIRIPYELIPGGYMAAAQIARSRTTMHAGNYEMEYGAVFSKDSAGFFKRSLIESICVNEDMKININGEIYTSEQVFFEPMMYGDKTKEYVIACDPAAMVDNLSIAILERDHPFRKAVYVWTTNKKDHSEKLSLGLTTENNYYAYAARKIRDLMKKFPTVGLAIDSEGGGRAIMEVLKDRDKLQPGELPIYHIIDPDKPRFDEDGETGLHIICEVHFSSNEWVANANHGMKKDMEDGILLLPYIDSISLAAADYEDEEKSRHFDTLQQCIKDIEELKNELSTIVVSETKTGKESWDTPEVKVGTGKKGRMRKDRYSALLMANALCRELDGRPDMTINVSAGGFAGFTFPNREDKKTGVMFSGPSFMTEKLNLLYNRRV